MGKILIYNILRITELNHFCISLQFRNASNPSTQFTLEYQEVLPQLRAPYNITDIHTYFKNFYSPLKSHLDYQFLIQQKTLASNRPYKTVSSGNRNNI